MALQNNKWKTSIIEITLHGDNYHEIINITGDEYDNDIIDIDEGGFNDVLPPKDPRRPFKIKLKKPLDKKLDKEFCHIQIKYPDGKIYGGNGFLDLKAKGLIIVTGG
jgi:hypothetical protein